ncbi:MAG: PLP-dependent aminotransferase family protein [Methanothrix sp.]|nr:PLP-dependent aminotransferase family protein [Methanothrix sp.]
MTRLFADRMGCVHRSFVREILKVTEDLEIISFAGGLPNPRYFPVQEVAQAAQKVLSECGETALQYSTTEGYLPLREIIADRYARKGVKVKASEILITNGSQQGLDLLSKIFLNKGDGVILERPTYLAAIQSFGFFEPKFHSIPLQEDGIDLQALEKVLLKDDARLLYSVPNFQNPTGITYSQDKLKAVAEKMSGGSTVFIEDNPYGDLRFMGEDRPSMKNFLGENAVLLGSFSKIVAPGVRLGWICACEEIMEKLIIAKQALDLHSNYLCQRIVHQYLNDNDIERHIAKIRKAYREQRDFMVATMEEIFPECVSFTRPEGGMFLWVTLPESMSSLDLFNRAIKEKVAFVPGQAFYADGGGSNTMRLNFSNSDNDRIVEGITRLGKVIKEAT